MTAGLGYLGALSFELVTAEEDLWTPTDQNLDAETWLFGSNNNRRMMREVQRKLQSRDDRRRFFFGGYELSMLIHAEGEDIPLKRETIERMISVVTGLEEVPEYDKFCAFSCAIWGASRYWDSSQALLDMATDEDIQQTLSDAELIAEFTIPDVLLYGNPVRDDDGNLVSAKTLTLRFIYPSQRGAFSWGEDLVDFVQDLDEEWQRDPSTNLRIEGIHAISYNSEFERGIIEDLPLVPMVLGVMFVFTGGMFVKCDPIRSQSLIGFASVLSVFLSVICSFGTVFYFGIPYTTIAPLLPFILGGIGLDDAFIVAGSFSRTNLHLNPVERIRWTMRDAGVSITLTSITSSLAFGLGTLSTVPAVFWLSYMAFPSVIFIYLSQITFFVACLALDARRMQQGRRDCCTCISANVPESEEEETPINVETSNDRTRKQMQQLTSPVDRLMENYATTLTTTPIRILVFVMFAFFTIAAASSALLIRQDFDVKDLMPKDSYYSDFLRAQEDYASFSPEYLTLFFRDVDQGDPEIQSKMYGFIDEMIEKLEIIKTPPPLFWLSDLERFLEIVPSLATEPLNVQLDAFLSIPEARLFYSTMIVRDFGGNVTLSRVDINMDGLPESTIRDQIRTLDQITQIVQDYPVNQGRPNDNPAFYAFSEELFRWEFFRAIADELVFSAIVGVLSVSVVALVFIPHWSSAPIVLPFMCILYTDLLGVLQWAGISINPVTYIILAFSVGLLVDFLMHILLRYYETPGTRREKVIGTLGTMGSSILLGGTTTFLGTLPLAFANSNIFFTVFIAFVGLVVLGITHGLILLPVVLATVGTERHITSGMGYGLPPDNATEAVSIDFTYNAQRDMLTAADMKAREIRLQGESLLEI